jgi:multiple sugar transport system permease protein
MRTVSFKQRQFAYLMTLPVVVALFALLIFPLLFSFYISTQSSAEGLKSLRFVGFLNYKEVFTSSIFWTSVSNTAIFLAATVSTTAIAGFLIALLLDSVRKGTGALRTIFILPLAVAPVVSGLTWGMMFNPVYGVVNYLLSVVGLPALGWATEMKTALLTIVIIDTWQWTPFMIIVLYAGLQMLPLEPYESARIDGATKLQEVWFITLPLLKPIFIIALIFRLMDAFKSFDVIYSVTKGGPGHATETMVVRAYLESLSYHRLEIGAVIGVILLVITFVVTKFAIRYVPK